MYTKKRLSREERLNRQAIAEEWMVAQPHPQPVLLLLLVTLASFAVGLIPIAYTLTTGKSITPTPSTTVAGEEGIWGVLGEK
jgi:hypothetical protein